MATGPQQKRKELREKRLKAEAAAKGADRRKDLGKVIGIAVALGLIAIVAVIVISTSGGGDGGTKSSDGIDKQLAGIPQSGSVLGDPDAEVTLIEFGDLQCPACRQYAEQVLPDVIAGPIKNGKANFDFRQWAILGEQSTLAAKAAYAAGEQDRYWQFLEHFYAEQGAEHSGYVTDEFLTEIAEKAGVPDLDKWNEDRENEQKWGAVLADVDAEATSLGFSGTPSFAIQVGDGAPQPVQDTRDADAIIKAINQAS